MTMERTPIDSSYSPCILCTSGWWPVAQTSSPEARGAPAGCCNSSHEWLSCHRRAWTKRQPLFFPKYRNPTCHILRYFGSEGIRNHSRLWGSYLDFQGTLKQMAHLPLSLCFGIKAMISPRVQVPTYQILRPQSTRV